MHSMIGRALSREEDESPSCQNFVIWVITEPSRQLMPLNRHTTNYFQRYIPSVTPYLPNVPISSPWARMCPLIAWSSVRRSAPDFKSSFVSRAIEAEEVAVWLTWWRAGTVIADLAKIVLALECAVRQFRGARLVFGEFMKRERQIVKQPVIPGAGGSVGIVDDQSDRFCASGRRRPGELGRDIRSGTRELVLVLLRLA